MKITAETQRIQRNAEKEKGRKYKTPNLATEEHRISQENTESSVEFCGNLCQSVANKNPIFLCVISVLSAPLRCKL
jgi:hypothetical protein